MFYVKNIHGDWLQPLIRWYHGYPTFTNRIADAGQFTAEQCDEYLQHPRMPQGVYTQVV